MGSFARWRPLPARAQRRSLVLPAAAAARGAFRPESADVVFCEDLADPYVLRIDQVLGELLLVFGTQTNGGHVPVWRSGELLRSEEVGDALPKLPAWSRPGGV